MAAQEQTPIQAFIRLQQTMLPQRGQRHDGNPPRWKAYERDTLLQEVNRRRLQAGKAALGKEEILAVEALADDSGDRMKEMAKGCAELVSRQP